jgi:predicted DCC family thiol-disulfide oxidoreductase YuxK
MKALTVLYDAQCGFCVKCRWWLAGQPKFVAMDFLPAGGPEAARLFPELVGPGQAEELTVVSDEGGVYQGARAWLVCLWALRDYREWSLRLATPGLLPLARAAFALVSASRKKISSWLHLATEAEILAELRPAEPPHCAP